LEETARAFQELSRAALGNTSQTKEETALEVQQREDQIFRMLGLRNTIPSEVEWWKEVVLAFRELDEERARLGIDLDEKT
jgi:hypothetical protein